MGWETRIFFEIQGNDDDDHVRGLLTLDSSNVREALVEAWSLQGHHHHHPKLSPLDQDVEERIDEYVWLHDCPSAASIGLKARGVVDDTSKNSWSSAYYTLFELKTIQQHAAPITLPLANWTKTSQYMHGDITDPSLLYDFCKGKQYSQPLAKTVCDWIQQQQHEHKSHDWTVPVVKAHKRRRRATLGHKYDVEEVDIKFQCKSTKNSAATTTTTPTTKGAVDLADKATTIRSSSSSSSPSSPSVLLRSWSVEGEGSDTKTLHKVARHWQEALIAASQKAGLSKPPRMWIASYPEMVLQLPELSLLLPPPHDATTTTMLVLPQSKNVLIQKTTVGPPIAKL